MTAESGPVPEGLGSPFGTLTGVPRAHVETLVVTIGQQLAPHAGCAFMTIRHDTGCPCEAGTAGMASCTCETVNIQIEELS